MRSLVLFLSLVLGAGAVAQDVPRPTVSGPAGTYTVQTQGPTKIVWAANSVVISWGVDPGPGPDPVDPPAPPDPPKPAFGPPRLAIMVYESSALTGREPLYSDDVRAALSKAIPAGADGRPAWRVWDRDVNASLEPAFTDAFAKAKADFGDGSAPRLYVFDAEGRMQAIPAGPDVEPAALVAEIEKLGSR